MILWTGRPALVAAVGLSFAASSGHAAPPQWTVDKARSRIVFTSAFAGMGFSGVFQQWDAAITFDPKDLGASKVSVTVAPASARTGDRDRDGNLPSADWFDTTRFPKATFISTSIKAAGPGRYLAQGVLTLKGVARPLSLPFSLKIDGVAAMMTSQLPLDRSQWKVGAGQFTGEDAVPHAVQLKITLAATRR